MKRSSTVTWHGSGKEGSGRINSGSKALDHASFSYSSRFEEEKGSNPEELLAAAHASCFTMKLSFILSDAGHTPDVIKTKCTVSLENGKISTSNLDVRANVPGLTQIKFEQYAEDAKNNCMVSKALNLDITMTAHLSDETVSNNEIQKTEV
jgi:lipoyl-dependent peroxiredoxin